MAEVPADPDDQERGDGDDQDDDERNPHLLQKSEHRTLRTVGLSASEMSPRYAD